MMFTTNNLVKKRRDYNNDVYIIVATSTENTTGILFEQGFDYAIRKFADSNGIIRDNTKIEFVSENDLCI